MTVRKITAVTSLALACFCSGVWAKKKSLDPRDYPVNAEVVSYMEKEVVTGVHQNPNCVNPAKNMEAYCKASGGDIKSTQQTEVTLKVRMPDGLYIVQGRVALRPGPYHAAIVSQKHRKKFQLLYEREKDGKPDVAEFAVVGMESDPEKQTAK